MSKPLPFKMLQETPMEKYRAESFWTKEPETLAWIRSFRPDSVFFDVGANVGVYSLYCAAVRASESIFAFEPDRKNFYRLQTNCLINAFQDRIMTVQVAVADQDGSDIFYEHLPESGTSGGQLGITPSESWRKYPVQVQTIDTLAYFYAPPNHIKVDIDGQELRVVRGMKATLENPELRSVLIEVDRDKDKASEAAEIESTFYAAGFTSDNRWNAMPNHSRFRRAKEHINVENIIFTRT